VIDLGFSIDNQLSMSDHIASICRSCHFQLRQLRAVRRSLTTAAAKTLVHAFVGGRIDYCNSLLSGVSDSLLQRFSSSRTRQHGWSRECVSLTTSHPLFVTCTGCQCVNGSSTRLRCWFSNVCTGWRRRIWPTTLYLCRLLLADNSCDLLTLAFCSSQDRGHQ